MMGLDMSLVCGDEATDVENLGDALKLKEICYWRKHYKLAEAFDNLEEDGFSYSTYGGHGTAGPLTLEHVDKLLARLEEPGFYDEGGIEAQKQYDRTGLNKAREHILAGRYVYYDYC